MGARASLPTPTIEDAPCTAGTASCTTEDASSTTEDALCTNEDGLYTVEDIPGKGRGLIANKDIPKGTRIISEKPAMAVGKATSMEQSEATIYEQVRALSKEHARDFLLMQNAYPFTNFKERWRGICLTNALPMGPNLDIGGIFFQACLINHACQSNATNVWDDNLGELTVQAVRDISKGEEITISYLPCNRDRQTRQAELQRKFKFTCLCHLCSLPHDQSRKSDLKLNRLHKIDCIIEQAGVFGLILNPHQMLSFVDEQVRLWSEPVPDDIGLLRAYLEAFQIAVTNGDLARARVFAERVLPLCVTTIGADSPGAVRYKELIRDPTIDQNYGVTMSWRTTLDEIPRGLGAKEFEDWLWRR